MRKPHASLPSFVRNSSQRGVCFHRNHQRMSWIRGWNRLPLPLGAQRHARFWTCRRSHEKRHDKITLPKTSKGARCAMGFCALETWTHLTLPREVVAGIRSEVIHQTHCRFSGIIMLIERQACRHSKSSELHTLLEGYGAIHSQ